MYKNYPDTLTDSHLPVDNKYLSIKFYKGCFLHLLQKENFSFWWCIITYLAIFMEELDNPYLIISKLLTIESEIQFLRDKELSEIKSEIQSLRELVNILVNKKNNSSQEQDIQNTSTRRGRNTTNTAKTRATKLHPLNPLEVLQSEGEDGLRKQLDLCPDSQLRDMLKDFTKETLKSLQKVQRSDLITKLVNYAKSSINSTFIKPRNNDTDK